jgi:hypothetical protein
MCPANAGSKVVRLWSGLGPQVSTAAKFLTVITRRHIIHRQSLNDPRVLEVQLFSGEHQRPERP